ncbi:hypothetical protein R3P38DRAFT_2814266 [Favolaschia claudopus]|uniref:Uncharacterized protein n=1 Tax=Favolaschia claudopus TaxID=2862362 RepID=A0AAV9Z550_9AGAR
MPKARRVDSAPPSRSPELSGAGAHERVSIPGSHLQSDKNREVTLGSKWVLFGSGVGSSSNTSQADVRALIGGKDSEEFMGLWEYGTKLSVLKQCAAMLLTLRAPPAYLSSSTESQRAEHIMYLNNLAYGTGARAALTKPHGQLQFWEDI